MLLTFLRKDAELAAETGEAKGVEMPVARAVSELVPAAFQRRFPIAPTS